MKQGPRYWQLLREAVEAHQKAVAENKNGVMIHCLEKLVNQRMAELDQIEKEER